MVVSELYFESKVDEHRIVAFGCYKEHKWTILSLGKFPTAYVENKTSILRYDDDKLDNIEVHGGFSYGDVANWITDDKQTKYLGWDYGHCDDYALYSTRFWDGKKWTYEEILADVYGVIDQLVELERSEQK